jgi:2-methylisocitrate lyase-like PEP mutase family enzyme
MEYIWARERITTMDADVKGKTERFQMLHRRNGILVMPNAWDLQAALTHR